MDGPTISTTDPMTQLQKNSQRQPHSWLPIVSLIAGALLIAASFFPIGRFASQSLWTVENSAKYDRVTQEYKRSAYQNPARTGLSKKENEARRERMKQQIDVMKERLEYAKNQPELWSRYFLWAGILLAAAGGLGHFASNQK